MQNTNNPFFTLASLITVLLTALFFGCSPQEDQFYISELNNKEDTEGITIASETLTQTLNVDESQIQEGYLSEMMEINDVIYLDNTVPVGKINKILLYNDQLCIFDEDITNTLNIFDRNGRHLNGIGQKGEGPGEYKKIHDVQINPYTNLIDIWDGTSQKMLSYDNLGNLLHEREIDIFASSFGIIDSSTYIFYKGNDIIDPSLNYKLIAIDAEEQAVRGKLFEIRANENGFSVQDPSIILNYNAANGKHYFTRLFDDHIYSIKDQQLSAEYFIDFKNKSLDFNNINFNQDKNKIINDWVFNPEYFSLIGNIMGTDDRLFFTFNKGVQIVFAFHHKEHNRTNYFLKMRNDITGTAMPFPLNADSRGNIYFADEPGMYFETIRAQAEYKNISEAEALEQWRKEKPLGYEIYNHLSEFDNPIILVGKYIFE